MKRRVIDVENTYTLRPGMRNDILPMSGKNSLVSVGVKDVDTGEKWYYFFNHKEWDKHALLSDPTTRQMRRTVDFISVQQLIDETDIYVGHNWKHDQMWLQAAGFKVPRKKVWDTAVAEYVMSKGQVHQDFSLDGLAEKHNKTYKKLDTLSKYFEQGINTDEIPMAELETYGLADLDATAELYLGQLERLQYEANISLVPTIQMMGEFSYVLAKWQANGIKIDKAALQAVKTEYEQEKAMLIFRLEELARAKLGDTPFSLTSGEDKSILIYSRKVKDKKAWKEAFNIGTDESGKEKRRPRMTGGQFSQKVRELTEVVYKTEGEHCYECNGTGKVARLKKDGTLGKARFICQTCNSAGVVYRPLKRVAGFKFSPTGVRDCSANGFATDADTLEALEAKSTDPEAIEFLQKLQRLNAVNVYIDTFCEGILCNLQKDDFLFTNFNQIVTATGRLSSTDPNFQNQPRGKTFPVRRAVISRFPGGGITEADYAQLEFRCAGLLSGDSRIKEDVLNGVDVHAFTRDTLNKADNGNRDRQDAKAETFKPLYGGFMGTVAQMAYYEAFRKKYKGHTQWQELAAEKVLRYKTFTLPTGRQYSWPHCKRNSWGRIEYFTQIVNYPVQGFATADIVPVACILVDMAIEQRGLRSVPFLTVHDSIAVDTYPGEEAAVRDILATCMLGVREEFLKRYDYKFSVPLEVEIKNGVNWLDGKKVLTQRHEIAKVVKEDQPFFDDPLADIGVD